MLSDVFVFREFEKLLRGIRVDKNFVGEFVNFSKGGGQRESVGIEGLLGLEELVWCHVIEWEINLIGNFLILINEFINTH